MSRYYSNYSQYLGAQRCCDLRGQGPQGIQGPTGPSAIGQRGQTGPTGSSVTGPTGRSCKGDTGPRGPTGPAGVEAYLTSMIGGLAIEPSIVTDSYFGTYTASYTLNATLVENNAKTIIPFDSTLSNLYIYLNNSPGIDKGYIFTVRNNNTDTAVNITILDNDTLGSNLLNTVNFNTGDQLTIRCVPINTPALVSLKWSAKLTSRP